MAQLRTTTFEDLGDPSAEWESIEAKLAADPSTILKRDICRRISLKIDEAAKRGDMLSGRQILWLIYKEYELEEDMGSLIGIEDLMGVSLVGGDNGLVDEVGLHRYGSI